jgi:hypothetical protein
MVRKRAVMEKIRRRGENAPAHKVLNAFAVKEQSIRYRNGVEATLVREFLRAVLQGVVPATVPETYRETAEFITLIWLEQGLDQGKKKAWTYCDINNAKRPRAIEPGAFQSEPGLVALAGRLCEAFAVDRESMHELLFCADLFQYHMAPIARDVVTAILNGPHLGIPPFPRLSEEAALPSRTRLTEVFGHLVADIDRVPYQAFPDKREPADRSMVQQLFRRAGLDGKSAKLATQAIVPPVERQRVSKPNPSQKKCLELFVQALHQPDLVPVRPEVKKIHVRLRRFGLTKSVYYRVRDDKFVGRSLPRTTENRFQIEKMAQALSLDPERFLRALLR